MKLNWDDYQTVLMLVRHQSLSRAGQELGVNYTTIARRIKRIEETLGTLLFEKTPDGYVPTAAAGIIAEGATEMEQVSLKLQRNLLGADPKLSGPLTITAPQLLIAHFLAPLLAQFSEAYPLIELRILATNKILDMTRLEADLAIRISNSPGDTLKGRRLLIQQTASFASRKWADRIRHAPSEMIDWIAYTKHSGLPNDIEPEFPNNRIKFRFNDMVAMVGAAQAGLGVVRLPLFLGRGSAELVQVPVLPPRPYTDVWVVGHDDVWKASKLRAFRDMLVTYCKEHRALFVE
ncbi:MULTISPECIES: LysR family transcriptional regulator [Halocynthiibacter]|uniref:LysR family transcriptional regulator n=1 Tax=Halocynthiibacter halioticoli TaxID=2986804 RepID=A0AAE3LRZ5_9RHOB|nr:MULTISPECIES: LysR family transcriptional regulator [Halocynthiibacter]MCV6825178.1 LysR family transcriptional regulator [Halocynthiibacter halioticoli]MCW4058179.1 LysR family transcriptional regulator [Halocynthiibacter sp. SDUM655004]